MTAGRAELSVPRRMLAAAMSCGVRSRRMAGPGELTYQVLCWALSDPATVLRYRSRLFQVPGSDCLWWDGALSGRGHGRFWLAEVDGRDVAIIAHRFGFALEHGPEELLRARLLGHRCDNPPCQVIDPRHVRPSTAAQNRQEWAARRHLVGSPLGDRRGSRGRARDLRDAVRAGGERFLVVEAAGLAPGRQLPLWEVRGSEPAVPVGTPPFPAVHLI